MRNKNTLKLFFLYSLFATSFLSDAAYAQTHFSHPEPLQPRIEAGGKLGTERSLGLMEGWMPIVQDDDSVLYGDIRWMADDDSNQEGNLGVGYRVMQGDHIVGGHLWIDRRRTDRGSNFHQVTGGIEFMKEDWDVKANAYVPLNKEKTYATANIGSTSPYLAGTGLFIDTTGQVIEEAQPGGDIELGYRLPVFENTLDAVRVYGGGYGFKGDLTDDVVGGRVRASIDVNPLLNVGARFQYDEPRGSQGFLEATLRFPFTAKKRFQTDRLRARMDESPERDIDIVTNAAVDNGLRKQVINTDSGQIQRVLHVDNTAANGGDGSVENPFNTLAAAQAALQDNDTLYIHQGNGLTTGQNLGFTIDKNNVQMIGSGVDFVYDTDRFTVRRPGPNGTNGALILAQTAAPVITNETTSSSTYVNNTHITTGDGIFVSANNVSISGITIDGATRDGIYALSQGGQEFDNIYINNVSAVNNVGAGIEVRTHNNSSIDNVFIQDSIANSNGTGIIVSNGSGSRIDYGLVENITSNQNGNAISIVSNGAALAEMNRMVVRHVTANNNARAVFAQIGQGGSNLGGINELSISDVTGHNNTTNGIAVVVGSGSTNAGSYANNINLDDLNLTADNSTYHTTAAVRITASATTIGDINITDSTIAGGGNHGIYLSMNGTQTTDQINITGNKVSDVSLSGVHLNMNGSASASISDNEISDNTQNGIQLVTGGNASFSSVINDNNIHGNAQNGLLFESTVTSSHNSSVSGNIITANATGGNYYGVRIDNDSTGTFDVNLGNGTTLHPGGNSIFSNAYRDIYVDSRPGTAAGTAGLTISAQENWWGVNTGLNQGTRATLENNGGTPGSTLDASNHLTAAPP